MTNSNISKYILFGVGIFALTLIYKQWLRPIPKNNISPASRFSQVITSKVSAHAIPRVREYVAQTLAATPEPEMCRDSRAKLLSQKIEEVVRDVADRRTSFDQACLPFDEVVTNKDLAVAIYKSCQRDGIMSGRSKSECWQALTFFKASLIAKSFGGRDLADADTETLIYLFMAKISQGEFRTLADFKILDEVTDRILKALPDSPSANKAAVIPRVVADFENMSKGEALNPVADDYLDRALKFNPDDTELQEVALIRKLYAPGEKISLGKATAYAEEKPQSSMAQYFLAGAFENSNRHDEALAAARRAHDMEPNNSRYRETLQKLTRGEKNAFILQMGVGFDNL